MAVGIQTKGTYNPATQSVLAGVAAQNLGPKKANEFDPYSYDVLANSGGAYGAKNQSIATNAASAAEAARAQGDALGTTGAAQQAQGVGMLTAGAGGYDRAGSTAAGALTNAGRIEGVANTLQRQGQQQGAFANTLQQQYLGGTGPSAAQAQLQAGTERAMRSNLALARSSGNPAAGYQAQIQNAGVAQQAANQAAQLRAQEQQQLLGQTLAAQGQATQTTQGAASTYGLGADTRLGVAGAQTNVAGGQVNAGATLAGLGAQQQGLAAQQQGLQYQGLGLQQGAQDADAQRAIMGAQAGQSAFESGRNYAQGAAETQAAALAGNVQREREGEAAELDKIGKGFQIGGQFAGAIGNMATSDERSKQRIADLERENSKLRGATVTDRVLGGGYGYDPMGRAGGVDSSLREREPAARAATIGERVPSWQSYLDGIDETEPESPEEKRNRLLFLDDYDPDLTGEAKVLRDIRARERAQRATQQQAKQQAATGYDAEYAQARAAIGGQPAAAPVTATVGPWSSSVSYAPSAGTYRSAVTSDERAKVVDMFEAAPPKSFEYREGYGPPGRRAGVMAQDLERSELGRSLVSRDPETGMRQVDTQQLTTANTAMLSDLHRRLKALEEKR